MEKWGYWLVVVFLIILGTLPSVAFGQSFSDYWARAYGEKSGDELFDMVKLKDGSMVAVGYTFSFGAGKSDALIIKFNPDGKIEWAKSLGGERYDGLMAVSVGADSSIIAVGFYGANGIGSWYGSSSEGGKYGDIWVVKFDEDGNILWQKSFGGPKTDTGFDVVIAPNGDVLVVGYTASFGSPNLWVIRLNSEGKLVWQRVYGLRSGSEVGLGIDLDFSENIIISGYWGSGSKALLIKLDPYGRPIWTKTYDGKSRDYFKGVWVDANGNIIVIGATGSFGQGKYDGLVMKLSSDGDVIWAKTYGGTYEDYLFGLSITSSGDLLVSGYSKSFVDSDGDGWILKLNGYGNVIWQKVFYGKYIDRLNGAIELNGAIYMVGWTKSFGAGYADAWLIRMPTGGSIECEMCKESKGIVNTATFSVKAYDISYSEGNPAIADTNAVIQDIKLRETPIFGTLGTLQISSTPSGAEVYLNGEYKGATPLELKLPEGKYKVTVTKESYVTWEEDIELKGGEIKSLSISLIPAQTRTTTTSTVTTESQVDVSTTTQAHEETSPEVTDTSTTTETPKVVTVTKTEKVGSLSICGPGIMILAVAAILPLAKRWK